LHAYLSFNSLFRLNFIVILIVKRALAAFGNRPFYSSLRHPERWSSLCIKARFIGVDLAMIETLKQVSITASLFCHPTWLPSRNQGIMGGVCC
jgi:hypothetical protein